MIPIYEGNSAKERLHELSAIGSSVADHNLSASVAQIIEQVRTEGDTALRTLAQKFGDPLAANFRLEQSAIEKATLSVQPEDQLVIRKAAERISALGNAVMQNIKPVSLQYSDFVVGVNFEPVARAACYIPSGRYPLPSTALMTALTARAAGVAEIFILCPRPSPEIIFAGTLAGIDEFYQVGGAQAVAAAAYGTESIKPADIIVGPGNSYVTEAKRQLQGTVGIDMLAGPSEIVVISDQSAKAKWVALDLLSQMEHGADSRAYLLTDSLSLARAVREEIRELIKNDQVPDYLVETICHSALFVLDSIKSCTEAVNRLAPEHVSLQVDEPELVRAALQNYGALFVGRDATVPFGDYMSGANHTLPTNRCARFYGALTPLNFLRAQNYLRVPERAEELAKDTIRFAQLEGLNLHAAAAAARLSP